MPLICGYSEQFCQVAQDVKVYLNGSLFRAVGDGDGGGG